MFTSISVQVDWVVFSPISMCFFLLHSIHFPRVRPTLLADRFRHRVNTQTKNWLQTASDHRKFCLIILYHLSMLEKITATTIMKIRRETKVTCCRMENRHWPDETYRMESSKWSPHDQTVCGVNRFGIIITISFHRCFIHCSPQYSKHDINNNNTWI